LVHQFLEALSPQPRVAASNDPAPSIEEIDEHRRVHPLVDLAGQALDRILGRRPPAQHLSHYARTQRPIVVQAAIGQVSLIAAQQHPGDEPDEYQTDKDDDNIGQGQPGLQTLEHGFLPHQLVAIAAIGFDGYVTASQMGPQMGDVGIHRPRASGKVVSPGQIEQLIAAHHLALMFRQSQ